jgi:hypothetical protein
VLLEPYLQGIFARELLRAEIAREWFNLKVNPLVTLQVMIATETLGALVTFEGSTEWH